MDALIGILAILAVVAFFVIGFAISPHGTIGLVAALIFSWWLVNA